jgi:hypothetical protein
VLGGATGATPFSTGKTLELAPFVAATVETFVLLVAAAEVTARLPFDSSSATRFSSCSMRSSIQRSRSVSGTGKSGFAGADFAGGLLVSTSSASERAKWNDDGAKDCRQKQAKLSSVEFERTHFSLLRCFVASES